MIGILSDSHDHVENLGKAIERFEEKKVEMIVHSGDVCSPFVWPFFRNLSVPIKCVLGNNVGDVARQMAVIKKFNLDVTFDPFFLDFQHEGRKFAVYHGDPYVVVDCLAKNQQYDVIVYGHDHVPKITKEGKTLLINPGSLITKIKSSLNVFSDENNPGPSVAFYNPKRHEANLVFL